MRSGKLSKNDSSKKSKSSRMTNPMTRYKYSDIL